MRESREEGGSERGRGSSRLYKTRLIVYTRTWEDERRVDARRQQADSVQWSVSDCLTTWYLQSILYDNLRFVMRKDDTMNWVDARRQQEYSSTSLAELVGKAIYEWWIDIRASFDMACISLRPNFFEEVTHNPEQWAAEEERNAYPDFESLAAYSAKLVWMLTGDQLQVHWLQWKPSWYFRSPNCFVKLPGLLGRELLLQIPVWCSPSYIVYFSGAKWYFRDQWRLQACLHLQKTHEREAASTRFTVPLRKMLQFSDAPRRLQWSAFLSPSKCVEQYCKTVKNLLQARFDGLAEEIAIICRRETECWHGVLYASRIYKLDILCSSIWG